MGKLIRILILGTLLTYGWQYFNGNKTPAKAEQAKSISQKQAASSDDKKSWLFSSKKKTKTKEAQKTTPAHTIKYAPSEDATSYYITENDMKYLQNYFKRPNPPANIIIPSGLRIHMKTVSTFYCPIKKKRYPIRAPSKNFVVAPTKPH